MHRLSIVHRRESCTMAEEAGEAVGGCGRLWEAVGGRGRLREAGRDWERLEETGEAGEIMGGWAFETLKSIEVS